MQLCGIESLMPAAFIGLFSLTFAMSTERDQRIFPFIKSNFNIEDNKSKLKETYFAVFY